MIADMNISANETADIWTAVRDRAAEEAVEMMKRNGWQIDSATLTHTGLMGITMQRQGAKAMLFVRDGRVGMINKPKTAC